MSGSFSRLQKILLVIKRLLLLIWIVFPLALLAGYFTPPGFWLYDSIMYISAGIIILLATLHIAQLFLYCLIAWQKEEICLLGEWHSDDKTYQGKTARILAGLGMFAALFFLAWIIVIIYFLTSQPG